MKRVVAFLFLVVVTASMLTPCCTFDACPGDSMAVNHPDDKSADGQGSCSPFSSCISCPGFTACDRQVQAPQPPVAEILHHEGMCLLQASLYYVSFFQPPRAC